MFVKYATAYFVMPGGFGTLEEFAKILILVATGKTRQIAIILVGSDSWSGLLSRLSQPMIPAGTIEPEDLQFNSSD